MSLEAGSEGRIEAVPIAEGMNVTQSMRGERTTGKPDSQANHGTHGVPMSPFVMRWRLARPEGFEPTTLGSEESCQPCCAMLPHTKSQQPVRARCPISYLRYWFVPSPSAECVDNSVDNHGHVGWHHWATSLSFQIRTLPRREPVGGGP